MSFAERPFQLVQLGRRKSRPVPLLLGGFIAATPRRCCRRVPRRCRRRVMMVRRLVTGSMVTSAGSSSASSSTSTRGRFCNRRLLMVNSLAVCRRGVGKTVSVSVGGRRRMGSIVMLHSGRIESCCCRRRRLTAGTGHVHSSLMLWLQMPRCRGHR